MKRLILISTLMTLVLIGCQNGKKNNATLDTTKVKVKIITFVSHEVLDAVVNSTKKSLIEDFNIPKDNIVIFNPNGNADEIRTYIRTLNSQNTDLIISVSTPATQAVLSSRHPSIPLLFSFVSDTSYLNLSSYKNVTGICNVLNYKKGFELLKQILPNTKSVCVVFNPSEPNSNYSYNKIIENAKLQMPPIKVITRQFTKSEEIGTTASTVNDIDVFYVGGDNKLVQNINQLLDVANNKKIPVFASDEGSVKSGAIAAYSIDYNDFGSETSKLAIDILKNKSCIGIKTVMYEKGRSVINKQSFINLQLDTTSVSGYIQMN